MISVLRDEDKIFKEISQNLLPKPQKYGIIMLYARTSLADIVTYLFFMEEHTNESERALSLR